MQNSLVAARRHRAPWSLVPSAPRHQTHRLKPECFKTREPQSNLHCNPVAQSFFQRFVARPGAEMSVAPPAWAKSEEGAALNAAAQAVDLTALQSLIDSGFHVDARDKVSSGGLPGGPPSHSNAHAELVHD